MTEEEWFACQDASDLLSSLRVPTLQTPLPERKARLFGLACCERVRHLVTDPRSLKALAVIERHAEGLATANELDAAFDSAFDVAPELTESDDPVLRAFQFAAQAVVEVCHTHELAEWVVSLTANAATTAGMTPQAPAQVAFVRDIFGNPFRPVALDPAWRTSDVIALAAGIYDERAFDRMPILADALQDAGCDNETVLSHCRDAGQVHVRGCWVVDLVLGKT